MKRNARRVTGIILLIVLCMSFVSAFASYKTLRYGDCSGAVKTLQKKLKSKGYYKGKADGIYGKSTKAAVKAYQKHLGIYADGVAGDKTLTALYEGRTAFTEKYNTVTSSGKSKTAKTTNPYTLTYGDSGERVKQLQKSLKKLGYYTGRADGVYGGLTRGAVRKFQKSHKLNADGVAGLKTLNALKKASGSSVSSPFTDEDEDDIYDD